MNDIEMRFDDNIIIGGAGEVQEKTVTPDAAGQIVRPDTGYDALSKVIVEGDNDLVADNIRQGVDVFGVTGNLEERLPEQVKSATPTAAGVEVLPDDGKTLSRVNIPAEPDMVPGNIKDGVEIFGVVGNYDNRLPEQTKTVDAVPQGAEITPDSGKTLSKVIINAIANLVAGNIKRGVEILGITGTYEPTIETQEKSATPGAQAVEVTPDTGKYLSKVTVAGDADMVANNIRDGVDIFGVTGNLLERKEEQVKTVDPTSEGLEIVPDTGKALSKVIINAIANLVAGNVKKDVTILDVTGTYEPQPTLQEKSVNPTSVQQEVTADAGYDGLSKVTVGAVSGSDTLGDLLAGTLENYTNNDIEIIPANAFYYHTVRGKMSFPNATKIMNSAFRNVNQVREIYAPNVTALDDTNGGSSHFNGCGLLEKITLGNITVIPSYAFSNCPNLTEITNLDEVQSCQPYAFQSCGIKELTLKKLQSFRNYIFYNTTIEKFRFEELNDSNSSISNYIFANNSKVVSIDMGYKPAVFSFAAKIGNNFATNCPNLETLIIRSPRGIVAANSSGFIDGTKIAAGTGYIYVPRQYVDTYKAASNWSVYASQFRALEDYTIDGTITGDLDPAKI